MLDYKYFASLSNRYDLNLLQRSDETILFDSIADLMHEECPIQHDIRPFQFYRSSGLLDSDNSAGFFHINGQFDVRGMQFEGIPQAFDVDSYQCGASFRFMYDLLLLQKSGISQTFDSIDDFGTPRQATFSWQHDLIVAVRERHGGLLDSLLVLNTSAKFRFGYDVLKLYKERLPVRWNAIPCDFLARQNIRFNANRQELAALPIRRQSLVRPGWRIFARNLFTDELMELGFIDQRSDADTKKDMHFRNRKSK